MRSAHPVYQERPGGSSSPGDRTRAFSTGVGATDPRIRQEGHGGIVTRPVLTRKGGSRRGSRRRALGAITLSVLLAVAPTSAAPATVVAEPEHLPVVDGGTVTLTRDWTWPVHPFRLVRPFVAPPHEYGPGHRGIDLLPAGDGVVRAPAPGVVAFSGQVAGRGVITVDHGDGLVSTFEPVDPGLAAGTRVESSIPLGTISVGGHAEPGAVHLGVRLDGVYINPLVLLGGVPRAVLLPCC
ncbi:Peptidase family M23 [Microbacterium trichothecenolyticum]|uniref:Peptidase family M23 n=1 Tax=Microbacterium trichothecenolyticum TaxID=69370 RepID=A0A0M2HGE4_MICTR|nr:Peptidase family M23 [Microbacterium trichothecenolyticum]